MANSSMVHVRVDDKLKAEATEKLAEFGLTISDAVRILLTRITKEGGLPVGLTADKEVYDQWFREKVIEALQDDVPSVSHNDLMAEAKTLIERKRNGWIGLGGWEYAPARKDLSNIIEYISEDNPAAALDLVEQIDSKANSLIKFPQAGREGRVQGTRELVAFTNYILIYQLTPKSIRILRVLHAARQWP